MYAQKVLKGVIKMKEEFYTYGLLEADFTRLKSEFDGFNRFSIGRSIEGRDLYAIKLGNGTRRVFLSGGFHGTEHLTAKVLMCFAEELCRMPDLADGTTVYIVPMVNPDGIEIASSGRYWQANARGVDINHNFDALWGLSKKLEQSHGITAPGATRYGGEFAESEPETKAIADFTRLNDFDVVVALHSQGEVIYYDFCGYVPDKSEDYLRRFEAAGRHVRDIPDGISAYGGYKDWFIRVFKRPGFTIEIGKGENPLPIEDFDRIYADTAPLLREAIR